MDTLDLRTNRHTNALNRLAHTLDVPVAEFFGEPANHEADDHLALVRLWSEI